MSKGLKSKGVLTINRKNEERKDILKGINKDVAKFLKDVDSVANSALNNQKEVDNKSSLSGFSKNTNPESQIMKDINDAFSTSTTKTKTKAEILLE